MKTARLFTRLRCPAETLSDGPFLNGRAIVARFNGRNSSGSGKTAHDRRCRRFPPLLRKEKYWLVAAPQRVRNFFYFSLFIISFFLFLFFSWLFNYLADAAPNWAQHGPPRQLSPETATSAVASEAKVHQRIGTTVRYYINRLTNPRLQTVAVTFLQLKSEKREKKGASIGPGWYLDISQISVAGLACPLIAPATRQQGENRCREKANGQVLYQITNG